MHMAGASSGGGGGLIYVSRGDSSTYDYDYSTMGVPTVWTPLDMSLIVPPEAVLVSLKVRYRNTTASYRSLYFGDYTQTNDANSFECQNIATGTYYMQHGLAVVISSILGYKVSAASGWAYYVWVLGWFKSA